MVSEEEHLAPGLIAAVTISSMFIFYFVLMMCLSMVSEEDHLAPGLIAAVTISSMFIFYFVLMMVVCLYGFRRRSSGSRSDSSCDY